MQIRVGSAVKGHAGGRRGRRGKCNNRNNDDNEPRNGGERLIILSSRVYPRRLPLRNKLKSTQSRLAAATLRERREIISNHRSGERADKRACVRACVYGRHEYAYTWCTRAIGRSLLRIKLYHSARPFVIT